MRPRTAALLALSIAVLTAIFVPLPVPHAEPADRTIRVEVNRYAFHPGAIRVNPGDRVTIELMSTDVVHGFALDGYGLELESDPGQTARLTFTADRSGTFRYRCTVTCGDMHPFMVGKFQVGPNTLLWRAGGLALVVVLLGVWRAHG